MAQRNVTIDLLRLIFAFIIVFHHIFPGTICGYLAVDFFFIVSGYMLIQSARNNEREGRDVSTFDFCVHRLLSFLPFLIMAEIFFALVSGTIAFEDTGNIDKALASAWSQLRNIFCLSMMNFYRGDVTWYLSAMMISTVILYPIVRRSKVLFPRVILPISGVFLIILILAVTGQINAPNHITFGFICKGLLRGLAEMSLGIFAYECAGIIREYQFRTAPERGLTVIESVCYVIVFICILVIDPTNVPRGLFEFLMVMLLFIGITITMSERSMTSVWTSNAGWLAEHSKMIAIASLLIYLNHAYVIDALKNINGDMNAVILSVLVVAITLTMCIICYHLGKRLAARITPIMVH